MKFQSRSFIEYLKVKSLTHKFQSEYGLRVQNISNGVARSKIKLI